MMTLQKILGAIPFALAALVASVPVQSALAFPEKEVELIVNYGAGGSTDLSTRVLAEAAAGILGQPLRVVNRAGGSGTVGPAFLAKAKPDGYTIGVASFSPMAVVPHLQEVPYSLDDFRFIVGHARYRSGLAVATGSPFQSMADVVEATRSGRELTYAATDALGAITMTRLGQEIGASFKWIRYSSGQEATTAALGGFVDLLVENPTSIAPQVKNGALRLLASTSSVRWYELPEVPTLKEQGYDVEVESYAGLAAPADTPDDVIKVLEEAFAKAINSEQVQATLRNLGMEPVYLSSKQYESLLKEGYRAMARDLPKAGLVKDN
ncbi:MAG: Bug family tripartite tricarboxylate transporter substrate binding protein [Kiloniellales bacterium]